MLSLSWFNLWKYRDDANCWDYVREWMIREAKIPADDVPKFGICPDDKRGMTKAYIEVRRGFDECEPQQFAIACSCRGRLIDHVGVVYNDRIWHTGRKAGTQSLSVEAFENLAPKTIYYLHRSLNGTAKDVKQVRRIA